MCFITCSTSHSTNTAPEVLHKSKLRIILVKFHVRVSFKIPDSCENIPVGDTHTHTHTQKKPKKKSQNISPGPSIVVTCAPHLRLQNSHILEIIFTFYRCHSGT